MPSSAPGCAWCSSAEDDFEVVAEAGDVDAALRTVAAHKPDVLVLDLNMPGELEPRRRSPASRQAQHARRRADDAGRPGVRAPGAAGRRRAATCSRRRPTPSSSRRCARAPRRAHLPQPGARRAARRRAARAGGPAGRPHRARGRGPAPDRARPHERRDRASSSILSVRTVESHRAHIQQKLGRSTRAELVRYALDHGLVERLSLGQRAGRPRLDDGAGRGTRGSRARRPTAPRARACPAGRSPSVGAPGRSRAPSSLTRDVGRVASVARDRDARRASALACLATLVSASWTRR